jgi:hypothetical protein
MYTAAIPMSGRGTVTLMPKMIQTPNWNVHAANDTTVRVSGFIVLANLPESSQPLGETRPGQPYLCVHQFGEAAGSSKQR